MIRSILAIVLFTISCAPANPELSEWEAQAANVTIIRDTWGIPHVYGKSDADAVFGMIYAQAEDDFNRIEMNYLNAMGRMAEAEGEDLIYRDLRMRLITSPEFMQARYEESPAWLKTLMDAFADGMNYYLYTHPGVEPKVITRFEPWMVMSYTEGSIGWDIERVDVGQLQAFYEGRDQIASAENDDANAEPQGSNGFAIAPSNSASGNALLLINPHTSFYYRAEMQMASDEGLNAYGAVTWGQFFIYQGFNEHAGWMHTSSGVDMYDWYLETITERDGAFYYQYGDEQRGVEERDITIQYKTEAGEMADRTITAYYTHHGPVVRAEEGKWVSMALMVEPVKALMQSFGRTKTTGYADYSENMNLLTNSSNNTVYADAEGNIAYWHGNFIPRRNPEFDFSKPVDGSNPATDWQGLHPVSEHITLLNPQSGWLMNTNNYPFTAAGTSSPQPQDYPAYMSTYPENPRGIHADRVLNGATGLTLDSLIEAAYDSYLTAFDDLLPPLFAAYDNLGDDDPRRTALADQIEALRSWDRRYGTQSIETSLAVFWGQDMRAGALAPSRDAQINIYDYMARIVSPDEKLAALGRAVERLQRDFGSWRTPWGQINRFQRLTSDIVQPFNDAGASIPVGFTSARWGSLAAYGQRTFNDTKRIYGTRGNSFVAVVEFGQRLRAKAITAGGQSGHAESPHFSDQAQRYASGNLRDVWFYREDVEANGERTYHPGS
jgi:acyl-homoserine-lactone acylase